VHDQAFAERKGEDGDVGRSWEREKGRGLKAKHAMQRNASKMKLFPDPSPCVQACAVSGPERRLCSRNGKHGYGQSRMQMAPERM